VSGRDDDRRATGVDLHPVAGALVFHLLAQQQQGPRRDIVGQALHLAGVGEGRGKRRERHPSAVRSLAELDQHAVAGDQEEPVAHHRDTLEVPGDLE
jgi:hypothetical protein